MSEKAQIQRKVTDALGREIIYNFPPQRIVSLVPSITELLFDIGVGDKVAGVTDYCIYPAEAKTKPKIGGTKTPNLQKIRELQPDLILAEKSENAKKRTLEIAREFPVYVFEVKDFDSAINMIRTAGDLVGKRPEARILSEKIMQKFIDYNIDFGQKTVFFPVWKNPYITVGKNTFINSMLNLIGLKNVFEDKEGNYPKVSDKEIKQNCPDFIFLTNEPYNFQDTDAQEFRQLCPASKVVFVKGEMFIWFGSRMLLAADYFLTLKESLFFKQ